MKPFRFGVNMWSAGSRAEWMDKARRTEELAWSVFTVPDHLAGFFAPMPALMSAAAATKWLRVGTNVLNNDVRHPALVARAAATADLLTDGRLQIGLGAGHMRSPYDETGQRFDAGGARVEAKQCRTAAWSRRPATNTDRWAVNESTASEPRTRREVR